MDLCTLGVFVGAILSTVRGAFFVWRRSASGTSQRGYDFKPPGFSHASSYPENQLLRCSIQICLTPFAVPVFSVSGWFGSDSLARIICLHSSYLSFLSFIFRNAGLPDPPLFWATPCLRHPMLTIPCWLPVNERIAGAKRGAVLGLFATAETTEYSRIANGQGRAGRREAAKAAEEDSPQFFESAEYS
ncbi:MAG TPA: hypothetical protein VK641_03975 [Terriglobales bacterium]|nr:hypothetical protein [Terriglobales bacterium]